MSLLGLGLPIDPSLRALIIGFLFYFYFIIVYLSVSPTRLEQRAMSGLLSNPQQLAIFLKIILGTQELLNEWTKPPKDQVLKGEVLVQGVGSFCL